ncbi:MAG: endoglucanase, partial [Mucilaginibacter sp.]|nr:endoglucanase [Mucilaginibacter sp.]
PEDGGVYNKCTNAAFDKMIMPALATQPRYVVQKGTAATLDFAAVMAQGARIFKKFNKQLPGLADSCMAASVKAWKWALINPDLEYNQTAINKVYEPKITTGAYGDKIFTDEWFWAAAELFATTNKAEYYNILSKQSNNALTVPSWSNVQMLGYYALLHADVLPFTSSKSTVKILKSRLIGFADNLIAHVNNSAFATIMGQSKSDFIWGSNAVAANQGVILVNAYLLTNNKKYIDNALTNLNYLLGLNATGYCFVTGATNKSPMHPHHRPSIADGIADPIPGLLVGGPNPGMQDGMKYPFSEPEVAYIDMDAAYACNEIAINWNAPLVYLANAAEALQARAGYSVNKEK